MIADPVARSGEVLLESPLPGVNDRAASDHFLDQATPWTRPGPLVPAVYRVFRTR